MYLKEVEIVGFKSFAEKTVFSFEPGMTCIVGPNGCGKSNVSDAIRWALGEQSAKALRGGKMQDVIFNGTDSHKPLSMAEVSLTLADCGDSLDIEYNEVKLTRRVLRSGEGQYFINKAPCRLKDIQRLFMDTGVGTNSYSVLEQGKIDQILSSRPEDRRAIFEEASGITRYKADRKEALRKLEHTEANLLRLDDIIREVKRQIVSLQRQAGKARRYKTMQEELRGLDIFATRERIKYLDEDLKQLQNSISSLNEQDEAATEELETVEQRLEELRNRLEELEQTVSEAMESAAQAQAEFNRNRQAMDLNRERIEEFASLLERDHEDVEKSKRMLDTHRENLNRFEEEKKRGDDRFAEAQTNHDREQRLLQDLESSVDTSRKDVTQLRGRSMELDGHIARLQNELADMDAREQNNTLKRERLAAEKSQSERNVEQYHRRTLHMEGERADLKSKVDEAETRLKQLEAEQQGSGQSMEELEKTLQHAQRQLAGLQAHLNLIEQAEKASEGYDRGARYLLEESPDDVVGSLADMIKTGPDSSVALQAVISASLSALVVENPTQGRALLERMKQEDRGAVKLVCRHARSEGTHPHPDLTRLLDEIQIAEGMAELAESLLGSTYLIEDLSAVPEHPHVHAQFVTRDGVVVRGDGRMEIWHPDSETDNPVARRQKRDELMAKQAELEQQQAASQQQIQDLREERANLEARIRELRNQAQEARRILAEKEGEAQLTTREATSAAKRLETVTHELKTLTEQTREGVERRERVAGEIETLRKELTDARNETQTRTEELHQLEQKRSDQLNKASEHRVLLSEARQNVEQVNHQLQGQQQRIRELEELIENRSRGAARYRERIQQLEDQIQQAEANTEPLRIKIEDEEKALRELREQRAAFSSELHERERELRGKRQHADQIRSRKNQLQIEQTEKSTRRQTAFERLATDYQVSLEDIMQAEEPDWEEGVRPDREALETRIAELRAKLESMGPVNLVAIEEHQELEERYAFLTQQQQDLVNSKAQLVDMIKKINNTTTELFQSTFEKVNNNFKETFTRLFGGGSAKLVMLDEEDVLETGIEIIARPPGKKLQTVSLLSGGERTMTAVALLFALFMVKPSPFCVLDEMDAALDEANVNRFVKMVQDFLTTSQFIVITHSKQTISAGDVLYGVTMQTRGISKLVSVKLKDRGEPELVEQT